MDKELETYREQLAQNPDDAEALARLEAALLEAGDWQGLVALTAEQAGRLAPEDAAQLWVRLATGLEEQATAIRDPAVASQVHLIIGQIAEQRLGMTDDAMRYYQEAFKLDSSNFEALEAARAIYVERENWDLVLQLYKLQADAVEDDYERAGIYLTMADLCERKLGQRARVLKWAARALEIAPEHPEAEIYRDVLDEVGRDRQARYDALVEESQAVRDPRQRTAMMLERAALWFDESPDDPFVEQVLRDVLEQDPRNDTTRQLLYEYYETNERWSDLVAYLEERANATARKSDRLEIYQRLAEIAQHELRDPAQAVNWHREVLKLSPTEQESLEFCVDHYSRSEEWEELVKVYEAALRTRHRSGNEGAMLVQIAMILWRKMQDLAGAENYFKRIKLNDPRNALMLQFYSEFYAAEGDYKRLLGVLGSRQNNEESLEAKIAVGFEMAEVAETKLKNLEKAIDIWKSILRLDAENQPARDALRRLYFDTGKWNALLEFLKEDLKLIAESDIARQVDVYRQMIEIYRDQLGLPVMVINTYNQILQVDPSNAAALDALEEKYRESQRWNDLIGILNRRAEAADETGDEGRFIELYRQIAGLWLDKFSNPNQAIQFLEGILERRPADEHAIKQLIDIYKNRKDWRALYGIYRRSLDLLDGDERTERLVEMARIAAKRLDERDEAITLWNDVLDADPAREQAWQALEGLYQKTERWDDLADLYERRVERLEDDAERVSWLKKLGQVYAERIGDEDRAAEAWRKVLRHSAGDLHAEGYLRDLYLRRADWDALEGLFGERGDWDGLVRLLNQNIERSADDDVRVALLKRAARVFRVNLDNEAGAVDAWERILDVDRDNIDAARTLAPHYTRTEQWDALVRVLEVMLRNEPAEPVDLMVELARVNEEHRDAPDIAFDWYARALREQVDRVELLIQVRRMAAMSERAVDLVDLLELLVDMVDDPEIEVRFRRVLAETTGEELGRSADAAMHYERVRELEGDSLDVLESLKALYQKLGRWDDLLEIYNRQLEQAGSVQDEARILAAIGQLHETVRDDPDAAQQAYERLRATDPESVEALRGLQRLADRAGDVVGLTEYITAELDLASNPDDIATLLYRLGFLAHDQGDGAGALDNFERVLEVRPEHPDTIRALTLYLDHEDFGPRAAAILEPFARSQEDWAGLRRVLLLQVQGTRDVAFEAKLLREVAEIEEARLGAADAAFATYGRLLVVDRDDADVRAQIERLADALQRWEEAAGLYARFALGGELADVDRQAAVLYARRLAAVQEHQLGRYADARATYESVLAEQGEDLELLDAVDRLTVRLEDWQGLVEVCERKLPLVDGADARVAMLFRIGALWEDNLDDPDQAIETWRRVLAEIPQHPEAVASLERVFSRVGRYRDLADLLEDRLADTEGAARIPLLFQLAQVLEHRLDAAADALERYAEVLEIDPGHPETRAALEALLSTRTEPDDDARLLRLRAADILEPIYAARGDTERGIRLLQIRLGDADVLAERVELRVRIARAFEDAASDRVAAFESYGAAMREDYGNAAVLTELLRLAAELDAWGDLATVLRSGLDDPDTAMGLDPVLKRDMLGRVAALYEERIGDRHEAIAFNRRVLDDDPDDREALESLDRLYARVDDIHALVEIVARRVELADDPKAKAALSFRLGELYELRLEDADRAIDAYARVREEIDPDDLRAHQALERLHTAAGNWEQLVEVQLDHAEHLEDTAARVALLFSAATTYETALDRLSDAVYVYRQVLDLDADNRDALAHLDRLYEQMGQPIELLEILERERELAAGDAEKNRFEYRMGVLQRDHIGDLQRAVECFRAVIARDPEHHDARAALEGLLAEPEVRLAAARILVPLYEKDAAWRALRDTLRLTLEDLDGPIEQVETLRRVALIEEDHLDEADAAFNSLAEAYRLSEADAGLEAELERLAAFLGDHAALADLLADVVALAPDRAVDIHLKIAIVADAHLDDAGRAIGEYRNVLALEPDNRRALDALEALYARTGAHIELVEILERKAELADALPARKALLERIAAIQEDVLQDADQAIETWRRLMHEDERDAAALDNLERLYRATERWVELSTLYEHRMSIVEDDATLAEFEYRLGRVSETRLGEGERALELYRQVLDRVPSHPGTRQALAALFADEQAAMTAGVDRLAVAAILEPLYRAEEDHRALVPVLEAQQAGMYADPIDRAKLLREIARLEETKLGDADAAFATCGRVLRLMADDRQNRADLRRLAEVTQRFGDLAALLEEVAAETPDPDLRVGLLLELGEVLERHCGDDHKARDVYREVLSIEPDNRAAVAALVELFTRTASFEDLVALYGDLAANTLDPEEQKRLYFEVCRLLEEVIGDVDRAIDTWRQVLAIEPDNQRAFKELGRFFREEERWPELADLLRDEIQYATEDAERAELRHQLGLVLHHRLEDAAGAVEVWRTVLFEDAPTHEPALKALEGLLADIGRADPEDPLRRRIASILEPLYAERERWADWVAVLEVQLHFQDDRWQRQETLSRIARTREEKLDAPEGAFEAYGRAFAEDYGNPDLQQELDRLGAKLEAWDPLVDIYERGLDDFADMQAAVGILLKVARIHDQKLHAPERAIESYRRVLALDEANPDALDALERILAAEERYRDLVEVLERKAEYASDADARKALLVRVSDLWDKKLDRADQAIETWRRVFQDDPSDLAAIEALIALYERTEQWELLIEMLREKLETVEEDGQRKPILFRIADTYEVRLDEPDETIQSYRAVLDIDPRDRQALDALERLFSREGRWPELVDLLEGERDEYVDEDPARVDALELRIGDVLEHQLGQIPQAIERYGDVLRRNGDSIEARAALERLLDDPEHRLLASRVLEPHYEERDEPDALARVYELQLLDLEAAYERIDLLKRLARLQNEVQKNPRGAFESYARAFQEDPLDPANYEALDALADELELHARLAELFQSRVDAALDGEVSRMLARRLARLYDHKLGEHRRAVESWQAVLNGDPYDDEALRALDRLYQKSEIWPALIEVLRRRIEVGGSDEEMYDLRFRLGYLLEVSEGDVPAGIEVYRGILWEKPEHEYALEAMERLAVQAEYLPAIADVLDPIYRDGQNWQKLAILTEMRIELTEDRRDRAQLWAQVAELHESRLNNGEAALDALFRAFDELPEDEEIRERLIRLATERGAYGRLADAFESARTRLDDPELILEDHLRVAEWCRGRLQDPGRAVDHYRQALEIDETNERALDALEELYRGAELWSDLAEVFRRKALALFDLDEKKARLHELAELCAGRIGDRAAAVEAYNEILDIDDADQKALAALERLHAEAGDYEALYDVLARRADTVYDGDKLAAIHRQMGALARDRLDDRLRAAESFEKVLDLDPDAADAMAALRDLYARMEEWHQLQEVLVKQLTIVEAEDDRVEVLFALGTNAETHLDRPENAIEYYRQILSLRGRDARAFESLTRLYADAQRYYDLVEMLRDRVVQMRDDGADPSATIPLLVRVATVADEHLGDADLAISTLNEVLDADPHHAGALTVLARLYERSAEWEKAAETLERALEHATGSDRAVAWRRIGLLYLDQLDQPEKARAALETAVAETGDDEALGALVRMARDQGDDARVAELLERRLATAQGAARVALLIEIADLRQSAGDANGAVVALEEAYRLAPDDLKVADRLLEGYFAAGRHADAEPVLVSIIETLKAARRYKELFTYNYRMGCVAEERGDEAAALDYFTQCFEYDATYVPNLVKLGHLHYRRQDWDQALKIFQTVLLHQMKLDAAGRVDVFYHLGQIRLALGDDRKAKDMFRRALGLDPDHAPSKAAMDSL
ncbi:MAG: tetratricopeptide repeat protein [Myxococcales bacterium]|nr:tetratricopeptide repeat protein [Myxococcales bacterium]